MHTNLVDACNRLKIEEDGVKRWQKIFSEIPSYQINDDGALKEWMHPDFRDNYHHRHQSHIYPLSPGFEINKETDARLFEACRVAVEKRRIIGKLQQTVIISHGGNPCTVHYAGKSVTLNIQKGKSVTMDGELIETLNLKL